MNKAHQLPFGDQLRLPVYHALEQLQVSIRIPRIHLGIMPLQAVVGQGAQILKSTPNAGILKRADPHVTGRHTGQDGSGQQCLPGHALPRGHDCQAARGRNPQPMHGFTDDVLPQHGPQRSSTVAGAGVGGQARSFELNIVSFALRGDLLSEQNGPTVPKHRKVPELMPRVSLRQRCRPLRHVIARKDGRTVITA